MSSVSWKALTAHVLAVFWLLVLPMLLPHSVVGQDTAADSARVMLGVAQMLRAQGEIDQADRLLEVIRRRYAGTEAAQLAAEILADRRTIARAGAGNTELIVFNTFYGAALGAIVPAALGADEPEPYGAGILLGAPIGYGLSKLYTKRHPVTTGQARAMTFGTWWGAWQGVGWQEVFDIGDKTETYCFELDGVTQCFEATAESDEAPFTATLLGGLSGLAVGTILGRVRPLDGSAALITNFSALWGSWYGAVLGVQLDNDDPDDFSNDDGDALLTTILVAGNIGLLAGAFGASSLDWSTGDAWAVHLSGIAGLIGGLGIDLLASVEDDETGMLIPGLTSAAALGVAAALVSDDEGGTSSNHRSNGSLLDFAGGTWSVGVPMPMPAATPVFENGRKRYALGGRVALVRMKW